MSKQLEEMSTRPTVRLAIFGSLAAAALLAGCVATVRVPGPPPVYAPPPPPAYSPPPPSDQPAVEIQEQASEPPPPLPDYTQPPCPEDGYLWTPGYWAYSTGGYYWIPGTWVAPPRIGVLWTPGYWGFVGGVYMFHGGYWGPHIGFYGGVNYGFGYGGVGFVGGRWAGNSFAYNTAVVNVNTTVIHNTYVNNVTVNNVTVNKVSYNGGAGGVAATPRPEERAAMAEPHVPPTPVQTQHLHEAVRNPQLAAKANGGHPPIAATARPASFSGPGVVSAKGAPPLRPVATSPRANPPGAHEPGVNPPARTQPFNEGAHQQETAPKAPLNTGARPPSVPPRAPTNTNTNPRPQINSRPQTTAPHAPAVQPKPSPPKTAPKPKPEERKNPREG
jgi:hypothetical protein